MEDLLGTGQLTQSQVAGCLDYNTDHSATCAKLSQLSFFGTSIDVPSECAKSPTFTYLLLISRGTTPGVGARTMVFLKPTALPTNARVDVPSGCRLLDFSADPSSLTKLPVRVAGPWVIDWRDITRDGQRNPVPFERIDGITVGFYAGMAVADLQSRIFDIELIATTLWDFKLTGGRTADLSLANGPGERRPVPWLQPPGRGDLDACTDLQPVLDACASGAHHSRADPGRDVMLRCPRGLSRPLAFVLFVAAMLAPLAARCGHATRRRLHPWTWSSNMKWLWLDVASPASTGGSLVAGLVARN